MTTDPERIAVLETKLDALTAQVVALRAELSLVSALVQQLKGARWVLAGIIAFGAFLMGKLTAFGLWLDHKP